MLQAQLMTICAGKHVYTSSTVPNVAEIYYSLPLSFLFCPCNLWKEYYKHIKKKQTCCSHHLRALTLILIL